MAKNVKLLATAGYLPEKIITNDDLSQIMETSDEWITAHTGIKTRHYAFFENTSDLATKVGKQLLKTAKLAPSEIDLIIVATITPDALTPSTAAIVQANLQATKAFAYDLSAACAGFVFALSTATKFLQTGGYRRAMVIAAETNSKMMDFKDRTSAVFFGDGAGGVIIEASDSQQFYLAEKLMTEGNAEVIHSGRVAPLTKLSADNYPVTDAFYQDGRSVYKFVTTTVIEHLKGFLVENKVKSNDLAMVITHQANLRLIEKIAKALDLPLSKFATDVVEMGNTSSAGIPLSLARAVRERNIKGKVLLCGFGAGLAYGSVLLEI